MGAGRKTQTISNIERIPSSPTAGNFSVSARNLRKIDLGGVIFGCKHSTMADCLKKQLFGLPSMHFSYVKNIEPGLPLFLFNYSDRKLHGIYEAATQGQMNIDSYAWSDGGIVKTPFPSQVRIRIRIQCNPLMENQFRKVIEDNYYTSQHFWFELDHAQARDLIALFTPSTMKTPIAPVARSSLLKPTMVPVASSWSNLFKAVPLTTLKTTGDQECVNTENWEPKKGTESSEDLVNENKFASVGLDDGDIQYSSSCKTSSGLSGEVKPTEPVSDWEDLIEENIELNYSPACSRLDRDDQTLQKQQSGSEGCMDIEPVLHKLKKLYSDRELLRSSSKSCINDNSSPFGPGDMHENSAQFSEDPVILDKKEVDHGKAELVQIIKELKERTANLEKQQVESDRQMKQLRVRVNDSERKIQLLRNRVKELESKSYPSMALDVSLSKFVEQCLGSENVIYLIGGFNGSSWLSALDSFSPSLDIVTPLQAMKYVRSYASAVTLDGNFYVFGGGDGSSWYDSVERYDPRYDEWTLCPNMIHEKGSLAGATLNSKIFAIGGGDGIECFSDVEMFDPALGRWIRSQSMLHKRFAPAAAELHGALYAVGGYDGTDYLQSAERFDPREGYWAKLPSMNTRRGCHSLAVFDDKLYVMGGYDGDDMVSSVEIFDPRLGSWMMGEPMNFIRGYAAAAVLGDTLFAIGGVKDGNNIVDSVECYREGSGWAITGLKAVGPRCFCSAIVL